MEEAFDELEEQVEKERRNYYELDVIKMNESLIAQIVELENDIEVSGMAIVDSANDLVKSRRENKQLREVLDFYADSKNYEVNVVDEWGPEIKVMMDGGAKAAKLLEELK